MKTSRSWRFGQEELAYVKEVLDSGFAASTSGSMNQRLEKAFAEKFGVRFAVTHNSGTSTMHSCLAAVDVGPGDEVIVPALGVMSTVYVVMHQNAVPVFADIDPETFLMDPEDVAKRITPRTKAIIPVALYGLPCDMDPIMELAAQHDLTVLEDNAQCYLGYYNGKVAGAIGDMASFSFENSKHMSTGDGGIVITDDEDMAVKVRKFSCLGFSTITAANGRVRLRRDDFQNPNFKRHDTFGYQYRLPEVCAAVGLAQLERLDDYVAKRQAIARMFLEAVEGCDYLIPQKTPEGLVNSYYTVAMRYEGEETIGVPWADFRRKYMDLGGDGVYAAWYPCYLEPVFSEMDPNSRFAPWNNRYYQGDVRGYQKGLCPVTESVQPKLMQFKTNYGELDLARDKAECLRKTIAFYAD